MQFERGSIFSPTSVENNHGLTLHVVTGCEEDGLPHLADAYALFALAPLPEQRQGLVAVCKTHGNGVVVLGYLSQDQLSRAAVTRDDADGWVTIGHGKSQIRLHKDGRIRIKAEDIALDSGGRMAFRGAWIDLN